jgi:hypothetical protein
MAGYCQHLADRRLETLGLIPVTPTNPGSLELQDVWELSTFKRRVSACQAAVAVRSPSMRHSDCSIARQEDSRCLDAR